MNRATQIALGAGVGYLVGRHRKLGLVAVLGGAVVAGRLSGDHRLLRRGAKLLGASSELGRIAELGAPLVAATRAAATSAVTRRIDSVSAGLQERTDRQRAAGRGRPDEPEEPAERSRRKLSDIRPTVRRGRRQADAEDDDLDEFEEDRYEDDDSLDEEPGTEDDLRNDELRNGDVDHPDADADDTEDVDDSEDAADADDLARTRPAAGRGSERKRPGSTSRQPARRRTPPEAAAVRRRTR
ncbi:hypothetical protein [Plantactinospora sp. KLBMP9567]|uniref:hypothetical protein n=1 Tax=Plantactinospora sp. KLBMP9567 TaxID=3085900 RepID=UPI002981C870|nr:hypothetical protein [Plantactinospora sp. KLBMP9567]MDW5328270.1 hypothetical protein [Plantactinospora sp. KLBMP9567]